MATAYLEIITDLRSGIAVHKSCDICSKLGTSCVDNGKGRLMNTKKGTTHEAKRVVKCEIYLTTPLAKK